MEKRLKYIDVAKGIAMICIILGHLSNIHVNRVVYTFHVPIFFIITGYFTSNRKSIGDFIKAKARTLLLPYFFVCLVIIAFGSVEGYRLGDFSSALRRWCYAAIYGSGETYTEPFYIPAIGALWFVWATFWGSCFLRLSLNFNKYVRIGFILSLFAFGYYSKQICWFPLSIQAGACATLFLYIGFLWKTMKGSIQSLPRIIKLFGFVGLLLMWFAFIWNFQTFFLVKCDFGRGIIDILGCVCACSVVMIASRFVEQKLRISGNVLAYIGRYSLLFLSVHFIELQFLPWWELVNEITNAELSVRLQFLCVVIGKLTFDTLVTYLLSKIKFIQRVYGYKDVRSKND